MEKIFNPNFILDIFVHCLVLFTFLSVFYYTYSSNLSRRSFDKEIENIIDMNIKLDSKEMPKDNDVKDIMVLLETEFSKEDEFVKNNNNTLFTNLLYTNLISWVMLLSGIYMYDNIYSFHYKELIATNMITFTIIGLAEFLFFTFIIRKYNPIKPSFISQKFIDNIKEKI